MTIYGASDDLVEVEGDIREEFSAYDYARENDFLMACSDGSLFRIRYGGIWRITPVVAGSAKWIKHEAPEGDRDNYSDRVSTEDTIEWVSFGHEYAKR